MGLLGFLVTLPLQPVRGVVALAEVIQKQVDEELHNPANARKALEEVQEAAEAGEISPEEEQEAQEAVIEQLTSEPEAPTPKEE